MEKRQLGNSGITVAPFCFGGNVFGWTADEAISFALLDTFTGAGFNFIDTADSYSAWMPGNTGGDSEMVIGNWLAARGGRAKVVIATKVGMWEKQPGLGAANIIAACEGSLKRLRTDYIDLYQSHRDDLATAPEETLEAFSKLVAAGKIRAIGASNFEAGRLTASLEASRKTNIPRYETLQPLYNFVDRDFEKELQPLCVAERIGVIPYFALAAGFLTGKYRNDADLKSSSRASTVSRYMTPENFALLERVERVAKERGAQIVEVAFAWLRDRASVVAPIASATNLDQLQSLIRAATLRLTPAELTALG